jgi:hypothetical protein
VNVKKEIFSIGSMALNPSFALELWLYSRIFHWKCELKVIFSIGSMAVNIFFP